ncbi:MAG: MATE family efflux transporter [Treponema sp.]
MKKLPAISQHNMGIAKNLWHLSYPTMTSYALQSFYDIVDIAWVTRISSNALSGVTLFTTIYSLFTVLNEVAGSSSVSMISQSYGRGVKEYTKRICEQTISFKVVLAIFSATLMLIFLSPLLRFYSSEEAVYNAAFEYGLIRIFFTPIMFSSYSVNTIFRCTGDSKTPMTIMFIASITNIVLDPILMFDTVPYINIPGFGLGVFGAALATVIATSLSFTYGFIILISGRREIQISFKGLFSLDKNIDLSLLKIGLPSGINLFVRQLSNATIMKFVSVYGAVPIAIAGIGAKMNQLANMPIFGFTMGGSALVGHALGRNSVKDAKITTLFACLMASVVVGIFIILVCTFPEAFMSFFLTKPEEITLSIPMVYFMSTSLLPLTLASGLSVSFSGAGDNKPKLYSSFISRWIVQIPFLYIVVKCLFLPLYFVWSSYVLVEIVELLVVVFCYIKRPWWEKRV